MRTDGHRETWVFQSSNRCQSDEHEDPGMLYDDEADGSGIEGDEEDEGDCDESRV